MKSLESWGVEMGHLPAPVYICCLAKSRHLLDQLALLTWTWRGCGLNLTVAVTSRARR